MRKQIITKSEDKLNIVILSNDAEGIMAKGIARCHAEDDYNEEFGIQLANTRAWLKYYDKIAKIAKDELDWAEEMVKFWSDEVASRKKLLDNAETKGKEIADEYDKMMKTI